MAEELVAELIAGRDWLFEGMSSYVDSTHLVSVLRFAPELEDPEMLRMVCEMAEYGRHGSKLNNMINRRKSLNK